MRTSRRTIVWWALSLAVLVYSFPLVQAGEMSVRLQEKAPPSELDESIRSVLGPQAVQLLEGDQLIYEFWFRREIPLEFPPRSPEKALETIKEVTFMGAVVVHRSQRDYKNKEVYEGVYTTRFALMPQDGDHLGTSLYPYFLLLTPPQYDNKIDALTTYRRMVKASGRDTATGHPVVLSMRPPSSPEGDLPKLVEPAPEHKAICLAIVGKPAESEETVRIVFDLVYEGHGRIQ